MIPKSWQTFRTRSCASTNRSRAGSLRSEAILLYEIRPVTSCIGVAAPNIQRPDGALFAGPDGLVGPGIPAHAERPEGLADPGALVFLRFQAARLHQPIGVLLPGAVREIVPEHGGRG